MAKELSQPLPGHGLGVTARGDMWWIGPLATACGFGAFILYSTFRAFYNQHYVVDTETSAYILSPFYSPLIILPNMPAWFSPAFFILWMPAGFRTTCYYYRKAYYRAYFLDPPACAVGEMQGKRYRGETFLLLFQNLHRIMLYFALMLIVILSIDAVHAMIWPKADGSGHTFGVSVATIILAMNAVLLGAYTCGCHSLRHLVGGGVNCFTCTKFGPLRYKAWRGVSKLNEHHMLWAWVSLFWVGFADVYVWMVSSGAITDYRLF